jgi:hypothetical protein
MADTVARSRTPEQAYAEAWGALLPRLQQAIERGDFAEVERIQAYVDRQVNPGLARAQGGPMPARPAGRETRSPTPGRDAVLAAGSGIDYGEPAGGRAPPLNALMSMSRDAMMDEAGAREDLARLSDPVRGAGAMPQSMDQERELAIEASAQSGRNALVPAMPAGRRSRNALLAPVPFDDAMPPATLTGREETAPPVLPGGIDYGRPAPGMPAIGALPPEAMTETRGTESLTRPMGGRGAMPQSMDEAASLAESGRAAVGLAGTGAAMVPVGRVAQLTGQAARMAGNVAARAPMATTAAAGGAALTAAPGEAEPPGPLDTARETLRKTRESKAKAELEKERLKNETTRFTGLQQKGPEAIRQAQQFLQERGLYLRDDRGRQLKPDGVWGTGMSAAIEAYQRRIAADQAKNDRQLETLTGDAQRHERAVQSAEGGERLREVGEPGLLQRYGPYAGYPLGYLAGSRMRRYLGGAVDDIAQARADRANALLTPSGRMPADRRFARVNQFWTEGGSRQAPFTHTPGRRPHPWEANPNATPAERLYRRSVGMDLGPGAVTLGAGAAEMGAGMLLDAHDRLAAATQAVRDSPSDEAAIQELVAARNAVAYAETVTNLGRGWVVGGAVGEAKARLTGRGIRPDINRAEGERAALDRLLPRGNALMDRTPRERWPAGTPGGLGGRFKGN